MDSIRTAARRALLFHLENGLSVELASALRAVNCQCVSATDGAPPDVIFCPSGAPLMAARSAYPGVPVVVVSRLPEADEWIEVLEAGAADYVAAPFEPIQMRWVLEALNAGAPRAAAAA